MGLGVHELAEVVTVILILIDNHTIYSSLHHFLINRLNQILLNPFMVLVEFYAECLRSADEHFFRAERGY